MQILQEKEREAILRKLEVELKSDVTLTLFTQANIGGLFIPGRECRSCQPTQQLLEEVVELSPKLHLEVVDYYANQADAQSRGVDKIPATIVAGDNPGVNHGDRVKYYGLPSGFEFAVLLDSLIAASVRRGPLQLETRRRLKQLREDVHIQVFVTPG